LLQYSAWLVTTGKAQSVSDEFFIVGHTHNGVDREFAIIGPYLKRTSVLEDPEEFLQVIKENLTCQKGMVLHAEQIHGVHDWNTYFEPLNMQVSGLTPTLGHGNVNHVWRVVRRVDLEHYTQSDVGTWEIHVPQERRGRKCTPFHGRGGGGRRRRGRRARRRRVRRNQERGE